MTIGQPFTYAIKRRQEDKVIFRCSFGRGHKVTKDKDRDKKKQKKKKKLGYISVLFQIILEEECKKVIHNKYF
jgi:hypothetical protein